MRFQDFSHRLSPETAEERKRREAAETKAMRSVPDYDAWPTILPSAENR